MHAQQFCELAPSLIQALTSIGNSNNIAASQSTDSFNEGGLA